MIRGTLMLLLAVALLSGAAAGGSPADGASTSDVVGSDDHLLVQEFKSVRGVEHEATLDTSNDTLVVESHNPTNETKEYAGYVVQVYDWRHYSVSQSLAPNETKRQTYVINDTLSIARTTHSVSVHGWGENASANFTFTKEIGTDSPERYPVPEIVATELVQNPSEERTGLYLAVTIRNAGEQSYDTYLYVHTNETDGNRAPAGVPLGNNRTTAYVPLAEHPSDHVQGEVRLYHGSVANDTGIRDQVFFEGSLESDTEFEEEPFDPITPPYEENAYEYGNDGGGGGGGDVDGLSLGNRILPATALALLVVVGLFGLLGLLFRLR